MTNEQILELAKSYGFDRHISKTTNDIYWECDEEDLLKFAQEIRKQTIGEISKSIKFSMEMKGDECIIHLLKVLKTYAEQKHCYERDPFYDVYDERELGETVEQAEEYAEIHFARTLLEQIGESFEYPSMRKEE